jgi:PHD/YefM family antitoxin component YafN of YafNO toxin-antitoxin module
MSDDHSQSHTRTYDVSLIAQSLHQLHEHVTRTLGRIEVTRPGSDERCVLISKQELESLERALEILSDTDDVRDMCGKIAQLAAATGPTPVLTA